MYGQSAGNASLIMALQTVALPLLYALLGVAVSAWCSRLQQSQYARLVLAAVVALGFWGSAAWIRGRWGLPPTQAMDVLVVAPALLLLGEWWFRRESGRQWLWSVLLVGGLCGWMLWPILQRSALPQALLWMGLVLALFGGISLLLQRAIGPDQAEVFWLGCVALAAPIMALGGTLLLAQLSGVLATMLALIWLAGLRFGSLQALRLVAPGTAVLLYCSAYFYADIHWLPLLLPAATMLIGLLLLRRWPVSQGLFSGIGTLLCGAVGMALSAWVVWPQGSLY